MVLHSVSVCVYLNEYYNNSENIFIPLKVSFELATNKKDFAFKSRLGNMAANADTSPVKAHISVGQAGDEHTSDFVQVIDSTHRRDSLPMAAQSSPNILMPEVKPVSPQRAQNLPHIPAQLTEEEVSDILLHTLLMVPDGKDFSCAPLQPNVYLNCKLFGSEETTRSVVSWGQSHPTFSLVQVSALRYKGISVQKIVFKYIYLYTAAVL